MGWPCHLNIVRGLAHPLNGHPRRTQQTSTNPALNKNGTWRAWTRTAADVCQCSCIDHFPAPTWGSPRLGVQYSTSSRGLGMTWTAAAWGCASRNHQGGQHNHHPHRFHSGRRVLPMARATPPLAKAWTVQNSPVRASVTVGGDRHWLSGSPAPPRVRQHVFNVLYCSCMPRKQGRWKALRASRLMCPTSGRDSQSRRRGRLRGRDKPTRNGGGAGGPPRRRPPHLPTYKASTHTHTQKGGEWQCQREQQQQKKRRKNNNQK